MNNTVSEKAIRLMMTDGARDELTALVRGVMDEEVAKGENMDASLIGACVDFLIAVESEENDAFTLLIPLVGSGRFMETMQRKSGRRLGRAAKMMLYAAIILSLLFTSNAVLAEFSGYNFLEDVAERIQQSVSGTAKADDSVLPAEEDSGAPYTDKAAENTAEESTAAPEAAVIPPAAKQQSRAPQPQQTVNEEVTPLPEDAGEPYVTRVIGNGPTKRLYSTDDAVLSLGGLELRFLYSDGTLTHTYYSSDAVVKTMPDFTQTGKQTAVLLIGGIYEYTYEIEVYDATPDTPENKRLLRLEVNKEYQDGFLFYLGDTLEDYSFGFYAYYSDGSKEYINYFKHQDEVTLEGLDLSEETVFSKTLTVTWQGVSGSAEYTVRKRRTVYKAEFAWREHPKTLYYKGEPLGYGVGVDTETVLPSLASFQALPKKEITAYGTTYNTEIYWSIDAEFQYDYMETQLLPEELDFVGYDPEQEGFQRIDIYYRGTYLLSYYVFVYGDSGWIPRSMPEDNLMAGDAETNYVCRWYYIATGGGSIGDQYYRYDGSSDIVLDADNLQPGEREVITTFADGTSYRYKKYARVSMNTIKGTKTFGNSLLKIPLADVRELPEELQDNRWIFTLSDGREVTVDPTPYYVGVTEFHGIPLTPHDDISSMFGFAEYDADRRFFDGGHRVGIFCYVYNVGFENAYSLSVECDASNYYGQYDLIRSDKTEDYYKTFMLTLRVSAVDNEWGVNNSEICDKLTVSGVDFGVIGDYTATFTLNFYGETLTAQRPVRIVETIYTPTLKIVSDPNGNRRYRPGDTFDITGAAFVMIDEEGNETPVSADNVTFRVSKNGSGHRLNNDITESWFSVTYSYLRDNGKYVSGSKSYRLNFQIDNAHFYYDKERHIIFGDWDAVDGADFYQFSLCDEVYTTPTNSIVINRGVDALLQQKGFSMRCGVYRDGQEALGTLIYFRTSGFPQRTYEEPTTEPTTEPITEPATEPTTEPTTESKALTPAQAQELLAQWDPVSFGAADGDNAAFDVTHDGVVNAKDYAVILRTAQEE